MSLGAEILLAAAKAAGLKTLDCGLRSREERWVQPLLVAPRETGALTRDVVRRHPAMGWAAEGLHAATLGETTGRTSGAKPRQRR